jgi:protein-disulfide isomerase
MSESGKNRRDQAAAAREAANAGEKKRERTVRIVGAITVLVVVAGIIGVAVIAKNQSSSTDATGGTTAAADPNAPLPKTVFSSTALHPYGVPFSNADTGVPVLEIWEDFQCPACQAVEKANGAGIETLATQGKVALIWRPTTFLDRNLGNDSSARAMAAWGCAIDQGKTQEFHNTIYANPPAAEGDGFTDEQLTTFAKDAGVPDMAAFTTCFSAKTYLPWAANSTQVFFDSNIQGTPYALLNGVQVPTETLVNQAALEQLVADTAAGKAPASAPASSAPAASATASPAAS